MTQLYFVLSSLFSENLLKFLFGWFALITDYPVLDYFSCFSKVTFLLFDSSDVLLVVFFFNR